MDTFIEQLIYNEVTSISNKSVRTKRERSLRSYYDNPNYCKHCGRMIVVGYGEKLGDVKSKRFCNRTCSAKHNNATVLRERMKSFVSKCSDDDFISAYNSAKDYSQLGRILGYSYINSGVIQKIKDRMNALGLQEYNVGVTRRSISGLTKGELILNRANWQSWRGSIQKTARRVYESSDRPKQCAVCGYDKTYEVAHIKSVSEFGSDDLVSDINSVDNLIALCPNHHWEFDHGYLDVKDIFIN